MSEDSKARAIEAVATTERKWREAAPDGFRTAGERHSLVVDAVLEAWPHVTPTPVMVATYPDFWIDGPGLDAARRVQCGHGYNLTDSCPNCDHELESIDGAVRAWLPNVEIATESNGVHWVDELPTGGCIAFSEDNANGGRGYSFTVYDAHYEVVTTDGGGEDAMYKVAEEITRWITGARKVRGKR